MKSILVILEKASNELYGRIEGSEFLYTTSGSSIKEIEKNLRNLLADYIKHEGQDSKKWKNIDPFKIEFKYIYDLTAFFTVYNDVKITSIAHKSGLNSSLLRQYVIGKKKASALQAKKIETAIRELGKELLSASIISAK